MQYQCSCKGWQDCQDQYLNGPVLCLGSRPHSVTSSCLWWCKDHVAAQHVLHPLQHHIRLMLQAPVLTMQMQQCKSHSRPHTGHHTPPRSCSSRAHTGSHKVCSSTVLTSLGPAPRPRCWQTYRKRRFRHQPGLATHWCLSAPAAGLQEQPHCPAFAAWPCCRPADCCCCCCLWSPWAPSHQQGPAAAGLHTHTHGSNKQRLSDRSDGLRFGNRHIATRQDDQGRPTSTNTPQSPAV